MKRTRYYQLQCATINAWIVELRTVRYICTQDEKAQRKVPNMTHWCEQIEAAN